MSACYFIFPLHSVVILNNACISTHYSLEGFRFIPHRLQLLTLGNWLTYILKVVILVLFLKTLQVSHYVIHSDLCNSLINQVVSHLNKTFTTLSELWCIKKSSLSTCSDIRRISMPFYVL